jgi:hypothetical protein
MTYQDQEQNPHPSQVEDPRPAGHSWPLTQDLEEDRDREQRRRGRARMVRVTCTLINLTCGLFAAVLIAHILTVAGHANATNGVAAFIRHWASGVSLGTHNLFTPTNATTRVVLNDGLAAIFWLGLSLVATTLIRRLVLPGSHRVG